MEPVTQRQINEWAAALQRARFTLIEDTGLRQPGETLDAYLRRVAQPLPGEKSPAYRTRIEGYIGALAQATHATAPARHIPQLRDGSQVNRQTWQRATRMLSLLPARLLRLRGAQQASQHPGGPESARSLEAELIQSMDVVLAAFSALRDARP